jgi:hypothetical protein
LCKATPLMRKSEGSKLQDSSNLWTKGISFCEILSSIHFSSLLDPVSLVAPFLVCNLWFSWSLCAYHHQLCGYMLPWNFLNWVLRYKIWAHLFLLFFFIVVQISFSHFKRESEIERRQW